MARAKKQTSDLFKFFNKMNDGDFDYIDQISDDEVKGLAPFVMLMWANGAQGANAHIHTLMTDMYCNPYVFSLSKHPRLLLKLFVAANSDIDNCRYKFRKNGVKGETKSLYAISKFYGCGMHEATQYRDLLTDEELNDIVDIFDFKE